MTIEEIRSKILKEVGIDCYSKSRNQPIPDVKKVFYRACRDFAEDYVSLNKFSKNIGVNHTTILHHFKTPLEWFLSKKNKEVFETYKLFYSNNYKNNLLFEIQLLEEDFAMKINHLKSKIKNLSKFS